jgi:hypothetical protein
MPDQKIRKVYGLENFFIANFTVFTMIFSFILVKRYLEHAHILELLSIFIWIIASIFYVYVQSKNLLNSKSENTLDDDNRDQYRVSPKVQRLISVAPVFILGTLFLILLGGNTAIFKTQTQLVGQPEFEPFNHYSNIALGIAFVIESLMNLFNIKKSLLRSILSLFQITLVILGMVMYQM